MGWEMTTLSRMMSLYIKSRQKPDTAEVANVLVKKGKKLAHQIK